MSAPRSAQIRSAQIRSAQIRRVGDAGRTVWSGVLPVAALVTALTALLAIATHAAHVSDGYALERATRETERRERAIQRLEVRRNALTSPAAIQRTAERLGVLLERPSGRESTSIDLDAHVRARALPVEDALWARDVR